MAANYSTGTATDQSDLLQKLVTFLVGQGWTNNMSQTDGSGWRAHLSKGSQYINLRAYFNGDTLANIWTTSNGGATQKAGIALYLGTGYNSASAWKAQAGGPIRTGGTDTVGANIVIPSNIISSYHFFDDGADNIVVVIEKSAGVYGAMGWGKLEAAGTITGGDYFFGQSSGYYTGDVTTAATPYGYSVNGGVPCSYGNYYYNINSLHSRAYFRADVDTFTGKWIGCGSGTDTFTGTGWAGYSEVPGVSTPTTDVPIYNLLMDRTSNAANGRGILLPINFYAARDAGGVSLVGRVPTVYATRKIYPGAGIVTYGTKNFMAFPAFYGSTNTPCSFLIPKLA